MARVGFAFDGQVGAKCRGQADQEPPTGRHGGDLSGIVQRPFDDVAEDIVAAAGVDGASDVEAARGLGGGVKFGGELGEGGEPGIGMLGNDLVQRGCLDTAMDPLGRHDGGGALHGPGQSGGSFPVLVAEAGGGHGF